MYSHMSILSVHICMYICMYIYIYIYILPNSEKMFGRTAFFRVMSADASDSSNIRLADANMFGLLKTPLINTS